jgi:hypothetical protein
MSAQPIDAFEALRWAVAIAAALVAPGIALLVLIRLRCQDAAEHLGLAVGLSVAAWPVLFLGLRSAGIAATVPALRMILGTLCLVAAAGLVRQRLRLSAPAIAVLAVTGVAALTRAAQAAGLVAPPWVDGLHHTEITALFIAHEGIPRALAPFMPVDTFYYHFGFHALAAVVSAVTGASPAAAVLWCGQALSAAAGLALYPLALRMTASRGAAAWAAAVPATLYWFPAYFVSWSRFTQLAGLIVVPVAWVLLERAARRGGAAVPLAGMAAAGLALTHYRVAVLFGLGCVALAVGMFGRREIDSATTLRRLLVAAAVAIVLATPWFAGDFLRGTRGLAAAHASLSAAESGGREWYEAVEESNSTPAWLFEQRYNRVVLVCAALGLAAGLARKRRGAAGMAVVVVSAVFLANGRAVGLPESWMMPNFALAIAAFVPAALGMALLVDALLAKFDGRLAARLAALVALVVVVAGAIDRRSESSLGVGLFSVYTDETIIVNSGDLAAADWLRQTVPQSERLLISTAHWHLGTYRGLDGGYWLPLLSGHSVSVPGALYPFGDVSSARAIAAAANIASRGDALSDAEIDALMNTTGSTYIYTGPAGADHTAAFHAKRLELHPRLEKVYDTEGVAVFKRR